MRTGNDVIKRVFSLLGYISNDGFLGLENIKKNRLYSCACTAVSQIYSDLASQDPLGKAESGISDMNQIVPLSYKTINDIMPYGVAMLVAGVAGEDELFEFFTESYNKKRAFVEKESVKRRDVFPKVKYGDDYDFS